MQKGMRLNDGHITYLAILAKKDGTRRGCLSKKSSDNTKWHSKWFALLQNMLFYFENDSSSRPSGLYLLEGCVCDRAPSPKPSLSAKECLEKQVRYWSHRELTEVWLTLSGRTHSVMLLYCVSLSERNLLISIWLWVRATWNQKGVYCRRQHDANDIVFFPSFLIPTSIYHANNFPEMLLHYSLLDVQCYVMASSFWLIVSILH